MKRLKIVIFQHLFKLLYVYLGCHIDSLANEWNYTVGDNHPSGIGSTFEIICAS